MEEPAPEKKAEQTPPTPPKDDGTETMSGSLSSVAWQCYKKEFKSSFVPVFVFAMLSICVLAVGIYQPWTLYLTLPLLELPFFFALQITISSQRQGIPFSSKSFFANFSLYYKGQYYGVYRVVSNALYAFFFAFLGNILVNSCYIAIAYRVDATFASGLDSLLTAFSAGNYETVTSIMTNNASINLYAFVSSVVELGLWYLIFVYKTAVWTLNPYIRNTMRRGRVPSRVANQLFLGAYRTIRRNFQKGFWGALWLAFLLLVLGFVLGCYLGTLWSGDSTVVAACGIAGSFLLTVFYVPYFLIVIELLATHYEGDFSKYSLRFAEETLRQLKENSRLSEEESKQIEKMISDAKDGKTPPSDDDNDDDNDYE